MIYGDVKIFIFKIYTPKIKAITCNNLIQYQQSKREKLLIEIKRSFVKTNYEISMILFFVLL